MDEFWKFKHISTRYKTLIYDAVIRSKLIYGLDSARMRDANQRKITQFQMKGLRKIIKLKHSYYDRNNSYENILKIANEKVNNSK